MSQKPTFHTDFSVTFSPRPKDFAAWLAEHLNALVCNPDSTLPNGYVVVVIPGVGTYKIYQKHITLVNESDQIALRVSEPITEDLRKWFEDAGAEFVRGGDHWKLFRVSLAGKFLGFIHLACRANDRPLAQA